MGHCCFRLARSILILNPTASWASPVSVKTNTAGANIAPDTVPFSRRKRQKRHETDGCDPHVALVLIAMQVAIVAMLISVIVIAITSHCT